ncbi:hypothetical protein ACFWJM_05450 [Streptomyces sp. NPDC127077]|uniref:hypothetical protein n=1 Tax=Streptomyces sp. NPDC127077 TaxID=3347131 RepID=UPI00366925FF
MTTVHATGVQEDRQPGSGRDRERGAVARVLVRAATVLVASAVGVAGTLLYERDAPPDTSAVDAQAAGLAEDLRGDLNAGFYSGGRAYGGQFTEGTLVAQVERHGGALLSVAGAQDRSDPFGHTAQVMLGLVPPGKGTVAAGAYPVRCYRYTFGLGSHSVDQSAMTCPASRTDGKPGSPVAQMGALLARQPTSPYAYRAMTTEGYAHTPKGALDFLEDKRLVGAKDTVSMVSGQAVGDGDVYVLALRINGVCHHLRMESSSAASGFVPLWAAPADRQKTCDVRGAAAAATLYGVDPAKAG